MRNGEEKAMSSEEFGAFVKRERVARQWTQERLSLEAQGLDQGTISAIERGRSDPKLDTLQKLARAFGMDWEDLARLAGYLPPKPTLDELIDRTPLDQLLAALATIPEFRAHNQLDQVKSFTPAAQDRLIRLVAKDFANLIQYEIERRDEERREQERREREREGQRNGGLAPAR